MDYTIDWRVLAGAVAILLLTLVHAVYSGAFKRSLRQANRRLSLSERYADELARGSYRLRTHDPAAQRRLRLLMRGLLVFNAGWLLLSAYGLRSATSADPCALVWGIFHPLFKTYSLLLLVWINLIVVLIWKKSALILHWQQRTLPVPKASDAQFYLVKPASRAAIVWQFALPLLGLLGMTAWAISADAPSVGTGTNRHLGFWADQQQRVHQCLTAQKQSSKSQ